MAVLSARPGVALRNIVIATDFSPVSELALDYATAIARHYDSKIHLVHALEPTGGGAAPHTTTLWGSETEADAKEKLRHEAVRCGAIECSQWVLKGMPQEVVERVLSLAEPDLVVLGTYTGKGLRNVAIGYAAEYFFRHSHCPVLAVGVSMKRCPPSWRPRYVLLTTDLQSDETMAARWAVSLARDYDARLALLHVAPPAPAPFPADQHIVAGPYFQSRLRELLSYRPSLDYPAEFWVEFANDVVAEIVRVARERAIDLIVLSVHRQEPWGFHFVHEAYRIVAEAPCPVLVTQRRY